MSTAEMTILLVTPAPGGGAIDWAMMSGDSAEARRIGYGTEPTWGDVRRVELISGVCRVRLCGPAIDTAARDLATRYGWAIAD